MPPVVLPQNDRSQNPPNNDNVANLPNLVQLAGPGADAAGGQMPALPRDRVLSESLITLNQCSNRYTTPSLIPPLVDAGAATTLGVSFLRYGRGATYLTGVYGLARLVSQDAPDLFNSRSTMDFFKHGLATVSDLAMIGGTASRIVAGSTPMGRYLSLIGLAGHAISSFLPDSSERPISANYDWLRAEQCNVGVNQADGTAEIRGYDIFVPTGDRTRRRPVVFVLPGVSPDGGGRGLMERETRINQLAQERDFIAVYPFARGSHESVGYGTSGRTEDWNSPGSGLTANQNHYDDVNYFQSMIRQIGRDHTIDPSSVYAVGFSSGGAFAQHLRGRMPGTFAGIGSVHGTLLGTEAPPRAGDQTAFVSVLSNRDNMLPLNGGRGAATLDMPRVATSNPLSQLEVARRANGYDGPPATTTVGNVELSEYAQPGRAPVQQYILRTGPSGGLLGGLWGRGREGVPAAHAWDGGAGGFPLVGEPNPQLDVSRLMIENLLRYRRPDGGIEIRRQLGN